MEKKSKLNGRKKKTVEVTVDNMAKLSQELNIILSRMKLSPKSRYYLTKLSWASNEHANRYVAKNNELISTLGTINPDTGNMEIPPMIKGEDSKEVVNENFVKYQNQIGEILNEKVNLVYDEIYLDDLGNQETEFNFPALFMLI